MEQLLQSNDSKDTLWNEVKIKKGGGLLTKTMS